MWCCCQGPLHRAEGARQGRHVGRRGTLCLRKVQSLPHLKTDPEDGSYRNATAQGRAHELALAWTHRPMRSRRLLLLALRCARPYATVRGCNSLRS